eukprot:3020146-Alexandrium_andersonii.AAC.1
MRDLPVDVGVVGRGPLRDVAAPRPVARARVGPDEGHGGRRRGVVFLALPGVGPGPFCPRER